MYAIGIPEDEERYKTVKDVWKLDESTFPTNNKRHQKTTDPRSSENSKQNKCQKKRKKEKSKFTVYYSRGNSEKAMASHFSTLAWQIPWMEVPGRLQSMGSLRVRHDWATSLSLFTFMHWRRKWQPTPMFLPGESQGWRILVGCRLWGRTESDMTEATWQQQQQQRKLQRK